mgnify:CR=1 FL=1
MGRKRTEFDEALVVVPTSLPAIEQPLDPALLARLKTTRRQAVAENTRRAYATDWRVFVAWCAKQQRRPLPASPETLAAYLQTRVDDGAKVATIDRAVTTISRMHRLADLAPPTQSAEVRETLAALRRSIGRRIRRVRPITPDVLTKLMPGCTVRDRAVLLLGYAGAFREAELVALRRGDLERTSEGYVIVVARSKTDQEGHGHAKAVRAGQRPETCPVRALEVWLTTRPLGPDVLVFPFTTRTVRNLVKAAVKRAGLDPTNYSGHSLRAGFVTEMRRRGYSDPAIIAQTGHRDGRMLGVYDRPESAFTKLPDDIGL